jgi:hypothetical protein
MAYYTIKNITSTLPKRHVRKNSEIIIDYKEGFQNKKYILKNDEEIVISCNNIPSGIQNLIMKNHITVDQINERQYVNKTKTKVSINQKATQQESKLITPKKETKKETKKTTPTPRKPKTTTTLPPEEK